MTLRARLTLLYSFTVGGILLFLGTAVYMTVSVLLTYEMDAALESGVNFLISKARAGKVGDLELIVLPPLDQDIDIYVQFWNAEGKLESASVNLRGSKKPLDEESLGSIRPVFAYVISGKLPWRVLTVPIKVRGQDRIIGSLQAGMKLAFVDQILRVLLNVLIAGCLISMGVAALSAWFSTRQALAPLEAVTQTALQITRADDLSRRIPYSGPSHDEVGQLIRAFNQTLSRLESLFDSQRRFLADVGHELRTPLTVIKGNVGLLRRMNSTDEESLTGIEEEVDRLTRLVGDVLLLAQAESGKLELSYVTVELDTILLEVFRQMRVLARDRVQLKLVEIDQVLLCGDQDRLKQVMVNLIGNAITYTPSGGEVSVKMGKTDEMAFLEVKDTGPGIPEEDLPYIFERFYRGEKSRSRNKDGGGFGLGLSITQWIVKKHGGNIEVTSQKPTGAVFTVWLPLQKGPCK